MKKIINLDCFMKVVTSLADILILEKALSQYLELFPGIESLFVYRFSKFVWHFLRLLECEMVAWS